MSWWQTPSLSSTAQWQQHSKVKESSLQREQLPVLWTAMQKQPVRFVSSELRFDPQEEVPDFSVSIEVGDFNLSHRFEVSPEHSPGEQWCRFEVANIWSKCKLQRCSCPSVFSLLLLRSSSLRHRHYPGKHRLWLLLTCSFHWQESQRLPVFCVFHDSQNTQYDR